MRIALMSGRFINNNVDFNRNAITAAVAAHAGQVDLVCFGEAFLQGFDCLRWNYETDRHTGLSPHSEEFGAIAKAARKCKTAVAFGYIESVEDKLYSSYAVISGEGELIHNFRRVSPGWKVKNTDWHYCEGTDFPSFVLHGKKLVAGLCGDLWYDENITLVAAEGADIVLWPVYLDYTAEKWETEKQDYAAQAGRIASNVLLVNSLCDGPNRAKGAAVRFKDGVIAQETPAGHETMLLVEI